MVNGPQWALPCCLPQLVPYSLFFSASSSCHPSLFLRALSQAEWPRLMGAHLFAFPSSSVGFSFKLFSSFHSFWISCSVVFLSSDNFPFAFTFLHTRHTYAHMCVAGLFPFILCFYHCEILERDCPTVFWVSPKMVIRKAPLFDSAAFNTGEHLKASGFKSTLKSCYSFEKT